MDVDDESGSAADDMEMNDDGDEDGEAVDNVERKAKKLKKSNAKNPRKSSLNMAALASEQEALAALESNQILHLRLRRKYYSEALSFIRMIEGAIDIITLLLGSTNKAGVLESMEFFRVAWEYQFDSAEVSRFTFLTYVRL